MDRRVENIGPIFRCGIKYASRYGRALIGENFVRYALLDVVGFAGEYQQGFILRFPSETRDGAVVSRGVEAPADLQRRPGRLRGVEAGLQNSVRSRLHQSHAEDRRRNAENDVLARQVAREIRLRQGAAFRVRPAGDGEQSMNAAIGNKAGLAHRTIHGNERRNRVGRSVQGRQGDLRIRHGILLTAQARTASAHGRLGMAFGATVAVERRAEAGAGFSGNTAGHRIHLFESRLSLGEIKRFVQIKGGVFIARAGRATPRTRIGLSLYVGSAR